MSASEETTSADSPGQETSKFEFIVHEQHEGSRLDAFVAERTTDISRVRLRRSITAGEIHVDGKNAKPAYRLKPGQVVTGNVARDDRPGPVPENIALDILFEDEHFAAVNKPPAMVVHPSKGHWAGTLASAIAYRFQNLSTTGGPTRPGIVHRLDRDTSGVILIAKTDKAHLKLSEQFAARTVSKEYFAIVSPAPDHDRDRIEKMIGAHPYQREKMAIRENHSTSRTAETFYEVIERCGRFATVKVLPKTGRTHQIRVHLASIGCPVLCDKLYSSRSRIKFSELVSNPPAEKADTVALHRQALHARRISFDHPESGERIEIEAPLPEDLNRVIELLQA